MQQVCNIIYLEIFLNCQNSSIVTIRLLIQLFRKGCDNLAFSDTFKALSDPVRRDILQLLKNGRLSAGEIASHFDMTGATISYHLNILKKADLVWETKVKNYVYYELNTSVVDEIMLWLRNLTTNMNGD